MQNYIYLSILIVLFSCQKNVPELEKNTQHPSAENSITLSAEQIKNTKIVSAALQFTSISNVLKVNGVIDAPPQNRISVSMPLGGFLKSTHLLPGMHVKKGEVLAVMEDQQYIQLQQDYLMVKSKLTFAQTEYQRQKELNQSKATSDKIFQQAEMEFKLQKTALNSLREKLQLIGINAENLSDAKLSKNVNLYSPIDGFVSKVNVNIGRYVNPTDVLFELINPDDIHLNITVFEKDVNQLFIGQKVIAYSNGNPKEKYTCQIILVSKDLSADKGAEVHCHFDAFDQQLLPGMYMNAEIEINKDSVPVVAEQAIQYFEGENYVFVAMGNNEFQLQKVEIGTQNKGFIEIINHKDFQGKSIVTDGAYTLLMALKNKSEEE